jgi:hypothetical protein
MILVNSEVISYVYKTQNKLRPIKRSGIGTAMMFLAQQYRAVLPTPVLHVFFGDKILFTIFELTVP